MMDALGPPFRYPSISESTRSETTIVSSSSIISIQEISAPPSPGPRLPSYDHNGEELPQYQEDLEAEGGDKAKKRRMLLIRLMTSLFVTVLVALIVAAVVGKINEEKSAMGGKRQETIQ